MDVKLYTGNGSTQTISGLGFEPDMVWLKCRSATADHRIYDQIRGATKSIGPNVTAAESTESNGLTAFTSTGFSLGDQAPGHNSLNDTYVSWAWDAGTSTVSNTQGSITSQVRANATAGFSVLTYTGTGATATIGHGLGATPALVIAKRRDASGPVWAVYHSALGANQILQLQSTAAASTVSGYWGTPSSTTFGILTGSDIATGGGTFVAYCFSPVVGYSNFGSYTGNGSSDGPFVYTGFRPRWIMVKQSSTTSNWVINDTARDTYNVCTKSLFANLSSAEDTTYGFFDVLSNGFKVRTSALNDNGATMIYAAFAEAPFNYSRAR
jgi:hypothetical protein